MSECAKAIKLSGAEIVTVAVRRVNITNKNKPLLMDYIDPKNNYLYNTLDALIQRSFKDFKISKRNRWLEVS